MQQPEVSQMSQVNLLVPVWLTMFPAEVLMSLKGYIQMLQVQYTGVMFSFLINFPYSFLHHVTNIRFCEM